MQAQPVQNPFIGESRYLSNVLIECCKSFVIQFLDLFSEVHKNRCLQLSDNLLESVVEPFHCLPTREVVPQRLLHFIATRSYDSWVVLG